VLEIVVLTIIIEVALWTVEVEKLQSRISSLKYWYMCGGIRGFAIYNQYARLFITLLIGSVLHMMMGLEHTALSISASP
jgi:hypothetical protein